MTDRSRPPTDNLFQTVQDRREIESLFEDAQIPIEPPAGFERRLRQMSTEEAFENAIEQLEPE